MKYSIGNDWRGNALPVYTPSQQWLTSFKRADIVDVRVIIINAAVVVIINDVVLYNDVVIILTLMSF